MKLKRWCLIIIVATLAAACAGKKEPPPRPTHLILEFEASADLNPNLEGKPSPLVVRIYELKSPTDFNKADFISLYEKDKSVLGGDLVAKQEVVLKPGEKNTVHLEPSDTTQVLGFFAGFRQYEQARWRDTARVRPHETTVVPISVRGTSLRLY